MKVFSFKELLKSSYSNYFTYEELYGRPDPKRLKYVKEQNLLNEGLILTHPIEKSIKVIENAGFEVVLFTGDKYKNRFFVEFYEMTSDWHKLLKIAENLGWYPSHVHSSDIKHPNMIKFTNSNLKSHLVKYQKIWVLFEPKYDLEVGLRSYDYLYHFTHKIFVDRIMKNGLDPRNEDKTSHHPPRIYLAFNPSAAEKFGRKEVNRISKINPEKRDKHNKLQDDLVGVILRIDVPQLPKYFKIYEDPNFLYQGCFTLNTVPPNAIYRFKEFDLNY
jgi:hypothetical protein